LSAISYARGHEIYFDGKAWRYSDNGNLLQDEVRSCIRCGKHPTKEGHDACIGYIEGVDSACCGHGVSDNYVEVICHNDFILNKKQQEDLLNAIGNAKTGKVNITLVLGLDRKTIAEKVIKVLPNVLERIVI